MVHVSAASYGNDRVLPQQFQCFHAAAGYVCRSSCCSIFKEYLNQTPNAYLTEYRISKSVELLANPDLSVTEIAMQCGFSGSSYFTETFRKAIGCTPSDYRMRKQQRR